MKILSRKLLVTLITILATALNHRFNLALGTEEIMSLSGVAASYVLGQSYVDSIKSETKPNKKSQKEVK